MRADATLALPRVFDVYQWLMGAPGSKRRFIEEFVRPSTGERVLDIGCAAGALCGYMPPGVSYVGVDISERYVAAARRRFGDRGTFVWADIASFEPPHGEAFDVVMAYGVFHHLDDGHARSALKVARETMKPDGRLVVAEPCLLPGQGRIEAFLVRHDRGKFVRTPQEYSELAEAFFPEVRTRFVSGTYRIPYTLVVVEATAGALATAPA